MMMLMMMMTLRIFLLSKVTMTTMEEVD